METLYLAKPSLAWKEEILAYKQAFTGEHLHGGSHLQQMDNFEEWLEHVENEASPVTCRPNRAPSSTFICIREQDKKMVGISNIRHHLNQEFLVHIAGHIGYSIHPNERRKGYAKEQLALALQEAKTLGINRVLITAADWNIGSQKTILANGGVYEDTRIDPDDGDRMLRYWIKNL